MEALTISDIDILTKQENALILMRKREAAHINSSYLIDYIGEAIGKIHILRQILQSRWELKQDKDL